jgi:two-component system, chemotaxis family, protein-glutamate methylesterase/glutaminase
VSGTGHKSGEVTGFDVIVVAASFGGPAALAAVLGGLPGDFPAAVLVVQHRTPVGETALTNVLRWRTALPVRDAGEGCRAATRGVTVLPARHTATVGDGLLRLYPADSARSADPLMMSVAAAYGPRAIAVVLTGRFDDGAAGVRAVRQHGGRTIAQDPGTASAAAMPAAAVATGCVDLVVPLGHIPHALVAFTMAPRAADLSRALPGR